MIWTESSWASSESYTANDSWIVCSSNGDQRETNMLRTPQPRQVSAQLYVWVNAGWRSRWCSQNLRRPFLRAGRFDLINYYITRHNFSPTGSVIRWRGTLFYYQECNVSYPGLPHMYYKMNAWHCWVSLSECMCRTKRAYTVLTSSVLYHLWCIILLSECAEPQATELQWRDMHSLK